MNDGEDGPEDLRFHQRACGRQTFENGGPDERAMAAVGLTAAIDDGLGTVVRSLADEGDDAVAARGGNHGAHLGGGIEAVAYLERGGSGGDRVAEPALRFADGDGDTDGETALAGAAECRVGDDLRGGLEIG